MLDDDINITLRIFAFCLLKYIKIIAKALKPNINSKSRREKCPINKQKH